MARQRRRHGERVARTLARLGITASRGHPMSCRATSYLSRELSYARRGTAIVHARFALTPFTTGLRAVMRSRACRRCFRSLRPARVRWTDTMGVWPLAPDGVRRARRRPAKRERVRRSTRGDPRWIEGWKTAAPRLADTRTARRRSSAATVGQPPKPIVVDQLGVAVIPLTTGVRVMTISRACSRWARSLRPAGVRCTETRRV
jgi:hypothetical protein